MFRFRDPGWMLILLLFVVADPSICMSHNATEESEGLRQFFEEMDGNHDGQVDELEAKRYIGESIGGAEFDSREELTEAFNTMVHNMNQEDEDEAVNTISQDEVKRHLHDLDQVVSVKEWVHHGLGLPQYAQTFKQNMITADDFPLLVNDDGVILEEELKISSRLHRNQIIRGLKRLILGLGQIPSPPNNRSCVEINDQFSVLHWSAPLELGTPPVHKYLIESGTLVREKEAKLDRKHYSYTFRTMKGSSSFRIRSWNAYGPSPVVNFPQCRKQDPRIGARVDPRVKNKETGSSAFSFWTFLVIGLTIGLRVLTGSRLRSLKCCFLWKLTTVFRFLKFNHIANQLNSIERQDCDFCRSKRHEKHSPVLTRQMRVESDRIQRKQHFEMDQSRLPPSASSPALPSPVQVDASGELQQPSHLEYNHRSWTQDPTLPTEALDFIQTVPDGLIEGQCAHRGCKREWKGAFQFRNRWSRHFCSLCLRTYCFEHTHISPHGAFGFCGQHSQCVCVSCFKKQSPEKQRFLESINRLDKTASKKAELEKGCCRKELSSSFRSMLGLKKTTNKGSKKSSISESPGMKKKKKLFSKDSQLDSTVIEDTEDSNSLSDQS